MSQNKDLGASAADATDRATDAPHGADKSSPPSGSVSTGAGHTPGPWHSDMGRNVWARDCKIADTSNPKQADGYRTPSYDEREANTRLIASAPDMFEALQAFVEAARLPASVSLRSKYVTVPAGLIHQARAALTKARGEF